MRIRQRLLINNEADDATYQEAETVRDAGPEAVALDFVDRINRRDPDLLAEAMTADREFVDTEGNTLVGREVMRAAWVAYFRLFPDYSIHISGVMARGRLVVLHGHSCGALSAEGRAELAGRDGNPPPDDELQAPAIWAALVRENAVAQWRVYNDTEAIRARLGVRG